MAIELGETDSIDQLIQPTESVTLEVEVQRADHVQLMVDNGTTGAEAAKYDLQIDYYQQSVNDYMQYSAITSKNAFGIRHQALGQRIRIQLTNTSGSESTYRAVLQSFIEL
jgi:hypothetical protein